MRKKISLIVSIVLLIVLVPAAAFASSIPDGEYLVDAVLSGGSGKTSVESPAKLTVKDGVLTATVVWSSPYYSFMKIDGVIYRPINDGGNSAFEIPVALDTDMELTAETTAMSQPHEIEYTLRFDSESIKPAGGNSCIWITVVVVGAAAIAAAVIVLRKRKTHEN